MSGNLGTAFGLIGAISILAGIFFLVIGVGWLLWASPKRLSLAWLLGGGAVLATGMAFNVLGDLFSGSPGPDHALSAVPPVVLVVGGFGLAVLLGWGALTVRARHRAQIGM